MRICPTILFSTQDVYYNLSLLLSFFWSKQQSVGICFETRSSQFFMILENVTTRSESKHSSFTLTSLHHMQVCKSQLQWVAMLCHRFHHLSLTPGSFVSMPKSPGRQRPLAYDKKRGCLQGQARELQLQEITLLYLLRDIPSFLVSYSLLRQNKV